MGQPADSKRRTAQDSNRLRSQSARRTKIHGPITKRSTTSFEDEMGVAKDFVEAMRAETGSFPQTQNRSTISAKLRDAMRRKLRRRSENHRLHASKKKKK